MSNSQPCNLRSKDTYPNVYSNFKLVIPAGTFYYKCVQPKHNSIYHDMQTCTEAEYNNLPMPVPVSNERRPAAQPNHNDDWDFDNL